MSTGEAMFKSGDTVKEDKNIKYEMKPTTDINSSFGNQKKLVVNGIGKDIVQDILKDSSRKPSLM